MQSIHPDTQSPLDFAPGCAHIGRDVGQSMMFSTAQGTFIRARSRRQAMDWSLVLASQEIDCTIEDFHETNGWGLTVSEQDTDRAVASIRQYEVENRGWRWRPVPRWPGLTFHWGSLVWCALLALAFALTADPDSGLRRAGVMDSVATAHGQWWRLATAVTLHADLSHLAMNLTFGLLVFGLAMARYGAGVGLLTAFCGGVAGNIASLLLYPKPFFGLGASGMIMGGLGMLAMHGLALRPQSPQTSRYFIGGVSAGVMLFVLFGLDPASDVVAHLGGFVAGLGCGAALAWLPMPWLLGRWVNRIAGCALAAIVVLTWRHALQ